MPTPRAPDSLLPTAPAPVVVFGELVLGLAGLAAVAACDWLTGPRLSFSVFYLLPIARVAWRLSGRAGHLFALLGAGVWMTIDLATQLEPNLAISAWNTLVRLSFFSIVVALIERSRRLTAQREAMAFQDPLTGLANSRGFRQRLELELARQRRSRTVLTVAYIDLDHFKQVNDLHGHDQGDAVLCRAAEAMAAGLRTTDLLARIGGDEFALLLPDTDEAGAQIA
ncbi:MAG: GGDEF domain-containing protein, partial [Myxococcales bacterium]|nr:GGDEF domain-containing protein [Myxococcales bacterium]